MFPMGGSRFSLDHSPHPFSGRWHQVAGRRINSSRDHRGVDGVNRLFRPRMQRRAPDPNLAAMGIHQGPEVDTLRSALSKAKQAAQERPLKELAHTDACIEP